MHCTLLIPGLLPAHGPLAEEAARVAAELRLPALERLLARGRRSEQAGLGMERWLLEACGAEEDAELPAGALSRRADALTGATHAGAASDDTAVWMRADPVHLRLNRDQLLLIPASMFGVQRAEAERLVEALNRHFAGQLSFFPLHPERWCVRVEAVLADAAGGLRTHTLAETAGRDVNPRLPAGPQAMRWHRLLNELQMLLHAEAVNDEREARGEPAVNSVWLWGAGALPANLAAPWQTITAEDALARGLAQACGLRHREPPADARQWLERMPEDGRHLLVLDALRLPLALGDLEVWRSRLESLELAWFAPLLAALQSGRMGMLTLAACDETQGVEIETTRSDLRRFWRRVKPYASAL